MGSVAVRSVQVRALAGVVKDIQRLHRLGCVFGVVVLLEGEPLLQSEELSALEVFIKGLCTFLHSAFHLASTRLPIPAAEKHPHSMMPPPPCFTVGMVPGFIQMRRLAFRPKSSILVSSD